MEENVLIEKRVINRRSYQQKKYSIKKNFLFDADILQGLSQEGGNDADIQAQGPRTTRLE